jgi:predicted PurR-regulated permease PerM
MDSPTSRNHTLWPFLACFILSIMLLGWLLLPFISIIVMAAVVTGLFHPIYRMLGQKIRLRPSAASLLTCGLIFLILFVPIVFFVGILTQEALGLYQLAKEAVSNDQIISLLANSRVLEKINLALAKFQFRITGEQLQQAISEVGKVVGLFLYEQARAIASNTFAFLVNFFLMLLVIFFLLIDGARLIGYIIDISPLPREQEQKLIGKFNDMAGAILIGNGLSGLIQGVAGGLVFWIFGLQSSFLWGVIMGLLAFLPIIGIGAVLLPAAAFLFLKGRIGAGLFFVVFYVVLSGGVEYAFKPRLVGQRVQMHTLLVFFSIIGGLKLFGILGIIYGPLVVTAFLTLADIYQASYQRLVEEKPKGLA